jgi:hypothetical protein
MNRSSNYQYKNEEAINFGERLYHKGIKLKEETEKKLEHYRREKENFDSEKYTHKPDVNELSIDQLKRRNENNMVYNKDEYILNYQQYLKDKLNKLREKHDKKEKFTFSPEINIRSTKMEEEKMNTKLKSSSLSPERRKRPDELYELSKIKELKLNQLSNQYYSSFNYKPEINQYQSSDKNTVLNLPFNERSELYRKKSEERKKLMQQEINSPIDRKTGQNLFVPKLMAKSRERINERMGSTASRHTSNIFNNLYSYAKKYSHNKEDRQMEVTTSIKRSSDSVHTINDSKLMFNKRKDEIFKKIFEILDSDQDNQISSFCIDTKKIPSNIINILNPIIVELNDENETLNLNEFVKACEHLFEVK